MEFIVLVIALLAEKFSHIDGYVHRFNWFQAYIGLIDKCFAKSGVFNGWFGLIILVMPILIVVAAVYYILASALWGFIGFVLSIAILIYCIGPRDLYTSYEAYFVAVVREDKDAKQKALKSLLCVAPEKEDELSRALTKSTFSHFNYGIFTTVFWFLIFGPLAPVLYRTVAEVHKYAHFKDSPIASILSSARVVLNVIEWVPARVAALGFTLMGDFHHGFGFWFKNLTGGLKSTYEFIQEAGLRSMGIVQESDGTKDMAEIKAALRLVDRTLVLFVVVVALIVLGAILY